MSYSALAGQFDLPMVVVTAAEQPERAGCLVGFHAPVSIDPPRYAVWLSKANHTFRVARRAELLAVHFLAADQHHLASLFGEVTEDEGTKFDRVRWHDRDGLPVLDEPPAVLIGRVVARHDDGDHVGHVLAPIATEVRRSWRPLSYQQVKGLDPGHPA